MLPDYGDDVLPPSDFPRFMGRIPLLSERAFEALAPLLKGHVQPVPMVLKDKPRTKYVALNVTRVVDNAIDFSKSEYVGEPGEIDVILKYAFNEAVITNETIFRDRLYIDKVLVTTPFVEAVESAKLTGARFAHGYLKFR